MTHPTASPSQTAPSQDGGGCLAFLLPPLTVLSVSMMLFSLLTASERQTIATPAAVTFSPTVAASASPVPLADLFTPEVRYWEGAISRWGATWEMSPNLVATVMQIESCGNPQAVSPAGAQGLFQVMPYHFAAGEDPFEPETNARRGLAYLRRALDAFPNDVRRALAAYNGGIEGARRAEELWPAETRRYVYWGVGIWEDAQRGRVYSSRLEEWLAAGGASLCQQAHHVLGLTP